MKILIGVGHPKQVHIWKNIAKNLIQDGNEIKFLATDKDITRYLLQVYNLDYEVYKKNYSSLVKKGLGVFTGTSKALNIAKKFNPDILIAGTPYLAYISKILGKPHITISDTEHAFIDYWMTYPFTDTICTPSCFMKNINPRKHITFDGYFELSYLHPDYFKPDSRILNEIGLNKNDKFVIIRIISWKAVHDIKQYGFGQIKLQSLIDSLEKHAKVFLTSESNLSADFDKYKIRIRPEDMHSLLYYSSLYIGEGGAMATEAGILGTPSIYVSSLVGTMGNFYELDSKYGLVYSFKNYNAALENALQLLKDDNLKIKWEKKKEKMLNEKINVTKFMVNFIENYITN